MIIGIDASRAFVGERTGTENYSYHLIKELVRLPSSQTHHFVLFMRDKALLPSWLKRSNVEVVVIKWPRFWTQGGLARETWTRKLDVLWVPAHTLPILRKRSLRTVVTIHGLEYKWLPQYQSLIQRWYLPLSTFYAAARANQIIAVSKATKRDLVRETGIDPERCIVIHEGAEKSGVRQDISKRDRAKLLTRYNLSDKKYLLFVGTLQPRKNLPALIKAMRILADAFPDYRLVAAGSKGWETKAIFQAVVEEGVQDKVIFTGRVSEGMLEELYRGAAVYVQPSVTEGFGLPVVEAMRRDVPVVVSDGGALPELVEAAGLVVKLNRRFVANLAKTLSRLLSEQSLQKALAKRGRARSEQLTWTNAAEKTLTVLTKPR